MSPRRVESADGRTVYRVDAKKTYSTTFYVLAPDKATAQEDADELTAGLKADEWDDVDTDALVYPAPSEPTEGDEVWTGGPQGVMRTWKELTDGS